MNGFWPQLHNLAKLLSLGTLGSGDNLVMVQKSKFFNKIKKNNLNFGPAFHTSGGEEIVFRISFEIIRSEISK